MIKVAFDIDDTLWKIDLKHKRQVPDYDIIQVLMWFYKNGHDVYVWSAGGVDYAQTIVDKLGLTDYVKCIPKNGEWLEIGRGTAYHAEAMDIAFDDVDTNLAKVDVKVKRDPHPDFPSENPIGVVFGNMKKEQQDYSDKMNIENQKINDENSRNNNSKG